jgi:hypothetical protein
LLTILLPIAGIIVVVSAIVAICLCLRRKKRQAEFRGQLSDVQPTKLMDPLFVDASSAVPTAPARSNDPQYAPQYVPQYAPQYASCQVVGYPPPVGPPHGAIYQSPVPFSVAVPQGPVYQPPQFVQVAGGYGPVHFPVAGYPYYAGGAYHSPPPQQPQQPQEPPEMKDGPH